MKFGDEEWFKRLEATIKFPSVLAFHIGNNKSIYSQVLKTKAKDLGNIKYSLLEPTVLSNDETCALASVLRCETSQEYYNECVRLKNVWSIDS